jgi:predicted TIM-barrel fold metal-dependent hydrolase
MLIDFHTHFFPDAIAEKSLNTVSAKGGVGYSGDGTLASLLSFMDKDGVDVSVNLPVATQPEQVTGINRKMVEFNARSERVICFGSMHPDFDGIEDEIAYLAQNGIRGIKLHSEYQSFCPDDNRLFPVYEACAKHNIIVVFHTGFDFGYTEVRCTPERLQKVLSVPGLKAVMAHMGGYRLWDDVEKNLVGTDCFFDLGCCAEMESEQLRRMILDHESNRILFASDFPWERALNVRKKIDSLGLDRSALENIYYRNAAALLQLPLKP